MAPAFSHLGWRNILGLAPVLEADQDDGMSYESQTINQLLESAVHELRNIATG